METKRVARDLLLSPLHEDTCERQACALLRQVVVIAAVDLPTVPRGARALSAELGMMAYRLSPEHPRPAGCKEGWLARWTVAVCRRLHTTRMLRLTTVFLPAYWCGVAAWLVRQTTLQVNEQNASLVHVYRVSKGPLLRRGTSYSENAQNKIFVPVSGFCGFMPAFFFSLSSGSVSQSDRHQRGLCHRVRHRLLYAAP